MENKFLTLYIRGRGSSGGLAVAVGFNDETESEEGFFQNCAELSCEAFGKAFQVWLFLFLCVWL